MAETLGQTVAARAYAKVNLTLEILGKRPDGFHEIASVVQTISLADSIEIERRADGVIHCEVEGYALDADENLVIRAAHLIREEAGVRGGAAIRLRKRIPVAAGLGGGSTDAAAALTLLNGMWGRTVPRARVAGLAATLGSDVPYFLRGGAAIVGGRGERVRPLPALHPPQWVVLAVVDHDLQGKTGALYRAVSSVNSTGGQATLDLATAIGRGEAVQSVRLVNEFAAAARRMFAGLDDIWRVLETRAGRAFHLSGAGPAVFCLATDAADAQGIDRDIQGLPVRTYVARTTARGLRRLPLRLAPPA